MKSGGRFGGLLGLILFTAYLTVEPDARDPVAGGICAFVLGALWGTYMWLGAASTGSSWGVAGGLTLAFLLSYSHPRHALQNALTGWALGSLVGVWFPIAWARLLNYLDGWAAWRRFGLLLVRPHTELLGEKPTGLVTQQLPAQARELMEESWGVRDRIGVIQILQWLRDFGHQESLDRVRSGQCLSPELEDFLRINASELQQGVRAWDWGRMIMVARWAATCGWLSRHEAWSWIGVAVKRIRAHYGSWEEYGRSYQLGCEFWLTMVGLRSNLPSIVQELLVSAKSPWRRHSWSAQ